MNNTQEISVGFERLLDFSFDMICIAGIDGYFKYLNPAWERVLGFSRKELLSRPFIDFIHPEDQKKTNVEVERLSKGIQTVKFENRYQHKDGSFRHLEWSATPDEKGLLYCVARDITERKQAEKVIQTFFEQPMNIHIISGFDGLIHRVNTGWKTILGYSSEELEGTLIYDHIHPEDLDSTSKEMEKLGEGQTTFYFENRYRHKDGSYRLLAWSAIASLEEQLIYAVASDITERKKAEEAMRESEAKFSKIFQSNPIGMVITQLDDGKCIDVNESFTELTGYSYDESIGRTSVELGFWIEPQGREKVTPLLRKDGAFHDLSFKFRNKEGGIRQGLFSAEILKIQGRACIVTAMRDITEQIEIEKELAMHRNKLEQMVDKRTKDLVDAKAELSRMLNNLEVAKEKSEQKATELEAFSYSVSHDLKAPLRGIDGYAKLLEDGYADHLDEDGLYFLKMVRQSTHQMNQVIDDLLSFSRLDQKESQFQEIDLSTVIKDSLERKLQISKDLNIITEFSFQVKELKVDPERFYHVIDNLFENAIKFLRTDGKPKIAIRSYEKDGEIIIEIEDNGVGFDMKYHDRIFEPFQRLERSEDYRGTGVGLSIVKKLMERMNGRVWAESEKGKGSAFYLAFRKRFF